MEILKIENLTFSYPNAKAKALDGISLTIKQGDFVLLCGRSGCGKTTFLRMLKKETVPHGEKSGRVLFNGCNVEELSRSCSAESSGFVFQNPEQQIVTDKVWHELAFGLENLGVEKNEIRRRTAETAAYFGIERIFRSDTASLSGGEKQLLNLASVMIMNPRLLILDEPTSQLDPIAAVDFINTIIKLNRDWGITVILSEHRTEELFSAADMVMVMEQGRVTAYDSPSEVASRLKNNPVSYGFPTSVRMYQSVEKFSSFKCPLNVKEARSLLSRYKLNVGINQCKKDISDSKQKVFKDVVLNCKNICFRYGKDEKDILNRTSFKVYEGEIFTLLGGNGAGKSTLLKVLSNLEKPYSGSVEICGVNIKKYRGNSLYKNKLAFLPQNPKEAFVKDKLSDDYREIQKVMEYSNDEFDAKLHFLLQKMEMEHLLQGHPYDLSGGEQQKAALIKILLLNPKVLLLDEPTKGMDAYSKKAFTDILKSLKELGVTLLIVTHDVEFASLCSDRCALLFNGEIISVGAPAEFFSNNTYYTTSACKIAGGFFEQTVTLEQLIENCKALE